MKLFEFKDTRIFFNDFNGQQQLILDYAPLRNHSNNSTNIRNQQGYLENTYIPWLAQIFKRVAQWQENGQLNGNGIDYLLTSLLMIQQLISKQRNFHILEIGCDTGALSVLIAEILRHFNSANRLICVSEEQVNTEQDRWLQLMSTSPAADIVSRYIGDFTELPFAENYFDLVIINGTTEFKQTEQVFRQAALVLRNQGILYGIADQRPDIDQVYMEDFKSSVSYALSETATIWTKRLSAKDKESLIDQLFQVRFTKIKQKISDNLVAITDLITKLNQLTDPELDTLINAVNRIEDLVIAIYNQLISVNLK
ncbi:class I SAM-dependent methyltransferase, partial [Liquorilactobacillus ghanensis]|uniref:class I SAM-dependent methyltransferase n=1 Tax=Liquorilactobacillus ghanensis TaxID=399370 RepID=UPI0039EAB587